MKANKLLVLVGLLVLSNGALAENKAIYKVRLPDCTIMQIESSKDATAKEVLGFAAEEYKKEQQIIKQYALQEQRAAQQAAAQRRQSMIQFLINQDMNRRTHQW